MRTKKFFHAPVLIAAVLTALACAPSFAQSQPDPPELSPASVTISYTNVAGGYGVTFDDSRTVDELYAAFTNTRGTDAKPTPGHTDDYFEIRFMSRDKTREKGATYQSGKQLRHPEELHEITGYDALEAAAARALWRHGYATFVNEPVIPTLLSLRDRSFPVEKVGEMIYTPDLNAKIAEEAERRAYALLDFEGTWVWQASEGDGFFETYAYTFKDDGTMDADELLPGGKRNKFTAYYGVNGKNLIVAPTKGGRSASFPFAFFNGQLQLAFGENTLVFDRKY